MPFPDGPNQVCRDCGLNLPVEDFSRSGRKDGYRRPECRSCQHARSKKINPSYQFTAGSISARERHNLPRSEIDRAKRIKIKDQNGLCVYCGGRLELSSCHLDHRTPLARAGTNEISNLQALCGRCNAEKHSKTHEEYIAWLHEIKRG